MATGLTGPNTQLIAGSIEFKGDISDIEKAIFADPQTSGGLFFGVNKKDADACVKKLHERGVKDACIVAEAFETDTPRLEVTKA